MSTKRQRHDRQYKLSAVQLVLQEGRKVGSTAKELGVHPNTLYRWVLEYEKHGELAFPGNGNRIRNTDFEIKKLKKQIAELEMENEILKKFQAFLKKNRQSE